MVKIRLKRMGAHKKPFYRVVVADSRTARNGKFIEELGYYDPLKNPAEIKVDTEKAAKWLAEGAQPTDTVKALLEKAGVTSGKKAAKAAKPAKAAKAEEVVEEVAEAAAEEADA